MSVLFFVVIELRYSILTRRTFSLLQSFDRDMKSVEKQEGKFILRVSYKFILFSSIISVMGYGAYIPM